MVITIKECLIMINLMATEFMNLPMVYNMKDSGKILIWTAKVNSLIPINVILKENLLMIYKYLV
jgi:hypothetical protein